MKQSGENVDYSWPCKDHINLLLWAIKQPVALTSDLFFSPRDEQISVAVVIITTHTNTFCAHAVFSEQYSCDHYLIAVLIFGFYIANRGLLHIVAAKLFYLQLIP